MRVVRDDEARELTKQNEENVTSEVVLDSDNELNLNSTEILLHTKKLPQRLHRLAFLPWYECWTQQLKTEKRVNIQ